MAPIFRDLVPPPSRGRTGGDGGAQVRQGLAEAAVIINSGNEPVRQKEILNHEGPPDMVFEKPGSGESGEQWYANQSQYNARGKRH